MRSLNEHDQVYVKSLGVLGKVLGLRPGSTKDPEEEKLYEVQITQYFRRTDLEPEEEFSKAKRLKRWCSEWLKEYEHFIETGLRCRANPSDTNLMKQWSEIGSRLGIFLPI
jgi:hypothetical protein